MIIYGYLNFWIEPSYKIRKKIYTPAGLVIRVLASFIPVANIFIAIGVYYEVDEAFHPEEKPQILKFFTERKSF